MYKVQRSHSRFRTPPALRRVHAQPHIVDTLIEERGRQVMASPAWPLLRPMAHALLRYHQAVEMADTISGLSGLEVFCYLSDLLQLNVTTHGVERVPRDGAVVLVSNHPTGIADGVVLFDAIRGRRTDLAIFANRDAIRVNPKLSDMIVPVEWRAAFKSRDKTKETLRMTAHAFSQDKAVALFPSGRLAFMHKGRLTERPWMTSAVALARKNGVPIIPLHMGGRNSRLFYALARMSTELRDMTVFNELLNKAGMSVPVHFGHPIDPAVLNGELAEETERLRWHCAETLARDPDAFFE